MKGKFLLLLILFGTPVWSNLLDTTWEKTGEGNGIYTYQRSDGSDFLQVKGIVIINQGIDKMGNVFRDIPSHVKWVGYCDQARVLKVINRNQYIFYETMTPPWPVSKRDMVLESKSQYENENLSVSIKSRAIEYNDYPPPDDTIRIEKLSLNLEMEYITRKKTGLIYEIQVDPAGGIPGFLSNLFNQFYVYQNLNNLQTTVSDNEYMKSLNDTTDTKLINNLVLDDKVLKSSLKSRLSRLIASQENLDFLVNDTRFMNGWRSNKSGIAEKIFLAAHDPFIARETIKKIIEVYLERYKLSPYEIFQLKNNNKVYQIFINESIKKLTRSAIHDLLIEKS